MAQPLELILSRQFADSLNFAAFLVDTEGNLLFYNESAEEILGMRFSETGSMPVQEWATMFKPKDKTGELLPPEKLPLVQTMNTQRPALGSVFIDSMDGNNHLITISSFPIVGRTGKYLGSIALFWNEFE